MSSTNSPKFIQIPVSQVTAEDPIRQLSEDNIRLHQVIDEMANTLALQKELIQQLRDEIARLKADLPVLETVNFHYNDLGVNFLRSETSFFLVSAVMPLQGIASGKATPIFSNSRDAVTRG